jgi:hypothetical protein
LGETEQNLGEYAQPRRDTGVLKQLVDLTGYNLIDESTEVRVALLSKLKVQEDLATANIVCN